jgi:hypothetical protein
MDFFLDVLPDDVIMEEMMYEEDDNADLGFTVGPDPNALPQSNASEPVEPASTPQPDASEPVEPPSTPQPDASEPVEPPSTPQPDASEPVKPPSTPQPDASEPVEPASTPQPDASEPVEPASTPQPDASEPVEPAMPASLSLSPLRPDASEPSEPAIPASADHQESADFFDADVFNNTTETTVDDSATTAPPARIKVTSLEPVSLEDLLFNYDSVLEEEVNLSDLSDADDEDVAPAPQPPVFQPNTALQSYNMAHQILRDIYRPMPGMRSAPSMPVPKVVPKPVTATTPSSAAQVPPLTVSKKARKPRVVAKSTDFAKTTRKNGDGKSEEFPPRLPFTQGVHTVLHWGNVWEGVRNDKYFVPHGFSCSRPYKSTIERDTETEYTCTVTVGLDWSVKYQVVPGDCPETVYEGPSPSLPWRLIKLAAAKINDEKLVGNGAVPGPQWFGYGACNTKGTGIGDIVRRMGEDAEAEGCVVHVDTEAGKRGPRVVVGSSLPTAAVPPVPKPSAATAALPPLSSAFKKRSMDEEDDTDWSGANVRFFSAFDASDEEHLVTAILIESWTSARSAGDGTVMLPAFMQDVCKKAVAKSVCPPSKETVVKFAKERVAMEKRKAKEDKEYERRTKQRNI